MCEACPHAYVALKPTAPGFKYATDRGLIAPEVPVAFFNFLLQFLWPGRGSDLPAWLVVAQELVGSRAGTGGWSRRSKFADQISSRIIRNRAGTAGAVRYTSLTRLECEFTGLWRNWQTRWI